MMPNRYLDPSCWIVFLLCLLFGGYVICRFDTRKGDK